MWNPTLATIREHCKPGNLFSVVLEVKRQNKVLAALVSEEASLLPHRGSPSCCVLRWPLHCVLTESHCLAVSAEVHCLFVYSQKVISGFFSS